MAKISLYLFILLSFPLQVEAALQCSREDTVKCGIDSLYASKVFRESMKAALGAAYDPDITPKKVRIHDGGWASFKLSQSEIDYKKRYKLPEGYFKKTQWMMLEISGYGDLIKSFQVDLDFQAYSDNADAANFKIATVENARITELPSYKVEEEKQRAAAAKMPINGFVCESEDFGIIVRGEPVSNSLSFGETFDTALTMAKPGKTEGELGDYRITISEFGVKKPPQLPPQVQEAVVNFGLDLNYFPGKPDKYDLAFVGKSPAISFWRAFSGYNKTQKFCSSTPLKGDDPEARKEICETDPHEAIEIKTQDKKWEKTKCRFYEKSAFSREDYTS
ncbi:MAG: hypothetical protein ACXVBE_16090 [Bdellovibrionota bacterium]